MHPIRFALSSMIALSIALVWTGGAQAATTTSFGFTGGEQTFTVPAGVTSIHVVAIGGRGGAGGKGAPVGGFGGLAVADLAVKPGQVLYVEVGGNAGAGAIGSPFAGGAGGFNGGGGGGRGQSPFGIGAGGGGGASDIRTAPSSASDSLSSRLIVAGGGGGSGASDDALAPDHGGAGGAPGSAGSNGVAGVANGGQGATPSAPGSGGTGVPGGQSGGGGALGLGGAGGSQNVTGAGEGGGGGGGLFGGGGGGSGDNGMAGGGGGGGGSTGFGAAATSTTAGLDTSGTPSITLTYKPPSPPSPPSTKITKAKISQRKHKAIFRFRAIGAASGFQCKLKRAHHKKPKAKFRSCRSPKTYKHLKPGRYTFAVRAVGAAGADPNPTKRKFEIG